MGGERGGFPVGCGVWMSLGLREVACADVVVCGVVFSFMEGSGEVAVVLVM